MQNCDPRAIKCNIGTAKKKNKEFVHQVVKKDYHMYRSFFLDRFNISLRQIYLALHANFTRIGLRVT